MQNYKILDMSHYSSGMLSHGFDSNQKKTRLLFPISK